MNNLGALYSLQRRYAEAEPLFIKVLEARKRLLGMDHQYTLNTMTNVAQLYDREGKLAEAERAYVEVLALRQKVMGRDHADARLVMGNLGGLYEREGKLAEAQDILTQLVEIDRRKLGSDDANTVRHTNTLGLVYLQQRRYEDVKRLLGDAVPTRTDKKDAWYRYTAETIVGAALAGEKKYAEAERMLIAGYEGLIEQKATIPQGATDPIDRAREWIVRLYKAWGKPDRAGEWSARGSGR
jgi:tetratricopeptide (TPR) repeat protein